MKGKILAFLIGGAIALALLGGDRTPVIVQPVAAIAQTSSPRGALITGVRKSVGDFNKAMDDFLAWRAEYVARSFNFVIGDMVGDNNSSSFVADDVDQCMTDFNTVIGVVRAGGTLSAGVWPNVVKVK
jgi:hypothetical protein